MILALALLCLSAASLFIGVIDLTPSHLITGGAEQLEILLISRLPRLLAILCTGVGMSVAGLMMQQLCMNKFVSPTTGATISSAQFGILLALLFMPGSTLWGRALFAFGAALAGTWIFVWFIQRIPFKDAVMVPLVGIMFNNVISGMTSYLAYKYEMTQALSSWLVGHFSMVLRGRYEIVYLTVPLVILAFLFANHFNIVGMGRDFSENLGALSPDPVSGAYHFSYDHSLYCSGGRFHFLYRPYRSQCDFHDKGGQDQRYADRYRTVWSRVCSGL